MKRFIIKQNYLTSSFDILDTQKFLDKNDPDKNKEIIGKIFSKKWADWICLSMNNFFSK